MTWVNADKIQKLNGKCFKHPQWKWCPYWVAKHSATTSKKVMGFRCSLFSQDKTGDEALPQCNSTYGLTYEGLPR